MNKTYFLALLAIIPIAGTALADANNTITYDDRIIYNLQKLIDEESYTTSSDFSTHQFHTRLQSDGWYNSTINVIPKSGLEESRTISFKFRENSDNTYTIIAPEVGIRGKFTTEEFTPDRRIRPPGDHSISLSDRADHSAYDLNKSRSDWCVLYTQDWSTSVTNSNYLYMVKVNWSGESTYYYACLFPMHLDDVRVSYERQTLYTSSANGNENFNKGSPPYHLNVRWTYDG